jgi:hypothetical protein
MSSDQQSWPTLTRHASGDKPRFARNDGPRHAGSRLSHLFSTQSFMPRGHSYLWTPALLVGEIAASLVIAVACAAMAVIFARSRRPGSRALAVAAVGLTAAHVLDAWVVWQPVYGVDLIVRCVTALALVVAAVMLPRLLRGGPARDTRKDHGDR